MYCRQKKCRHIVAVEAEVEMKKDEECDNLLFMQRT
jgi:hypothetical protein